MKKILQVLFTIVICICITGISIISYASNAVERVYENDFEDTDALDYWGAFGSNSSQLSLTENNFFDGKSLKMSDHEQSWYSPQFDVTKYLYEAGYRKVGTYTIQLKVHAENLDVNYTNARLILRSTSGNNNGYSFIKNINGNFFGIIGALTRIENNGSCLLTGSFYLDNTEACLNRSLYLCIDSIDGADNSNIYIDDIIIVKNSCYYIDNGDFSQGTLAWRSWGGVGEFSVENSGTATYNQINQYSSIGCNIDQILRYYGRDEYYISFDMRVKSDTPTTKQLWPYLSKNNTEFHLPISPVITINSEWPASDQSTCTIRLNLFQKPNGSDKTYYDLLYPMKNEVHFRMQYIGNEPFEYEIRNVRIYRQFHIEDIGDSLKFGERYVSGLNQLAVNGVCEFETKWIAYQQAQESQEEQAQEETRKDILCALYESNDNPGEIDGDKAYGLYQFTGEIRNDFVEWLNNNGYGEIYNALNGYTPGTSVFDSAWVNLADTKADMFRQAQYEFAKETYYDPHMNRLCNYLKNTKNVSFDFELRCSTALSNVIFSIAVQFGQNSNILTEALEPFATSEINGMSDLDFMAIFLERITRTYDTNINGHKYMSENDDFSSALKLNGRWLAKFGERSASEQVAILKRHYGTYFDACMMYYKENEISYQILE